MDRVSHPRPAPDKPALPDTLRTRLAGLAAAIRTTFTPLRYSGVVLLRAVLSCIAVTPLPRSSAVLLRAVLCCLAVTPLLRWAVVVHAVPARRSWRRCCPRCSRAFGPLADIGALLPTARCSVCTQRLGPPPWTLELATVASVVALYWSGLRGLPLIAYLWWAAFGIVLSFVDLAVQRLPTRLCYPAAAGFLAVMLLHAWSTSDWRPWIRSILGALLLYGVLAACALARPSLIGWGDVRYSLAIGAAATWPGWLFLYIAALLATAGASVTGASLIAAQKVRMTSRLPNGPFLCLGALSAIVLHLT